MINALTTLHTSNALSTTLHTSYSMEFATLMLHPLIEHMYVGEFTATVTRDRKVTLRKTGTKHGGMITIKDAKKLYVMVRCIL